MNQQQFDKMKNGRGFIAALDQSGGSTPKALKNYGIDEDAYSNDEEMFRVMHEMRSRIMRRPAFNGDRILGAILFEDTMNRQVEGRDTADYLWNVKNIVPIIKVDKGLADATDDVQLMKPIPGLDDLLARALEKGFFGTKMRSVIKDANQKGIGAIADQQFELGRQIADAGLVPILEPEIDIHSPHKAEAEAMLKKALLDGLEQWPSDKYLMFKLTLPQRQRPVRQRHRHPARLPGRDPGPGGNAGGCLGLPDPHLRPRDLDARRLTQRPGGHEPGRPQGQRRRPAARRHPDRQRRLL